MAAFIGEPIQGAGGVIIPPETYWPEVQRICREHDVLLIADEVICGFGRTGNWWGFETLGFEPDIVTMAKGLSSGCVPIAAMALGRRVGDAVFHAEKEFTHGVTYAGHPLAAAVALENIAIMEEEGLATRAAGPIGAAFRDGLISLADHPLVGEVRTCGLIGCVELCSRQGAARAVRARGPGRPSLPRPLRRERAGDAGDPRRDGAGAPARDHRGADRRDRGGGTQEPRRDGTAYRPRLSWSRPLIHRANLRLLLVLRDTWALLLGIALLMLGHGLQGTLLGVRAGLEQFPPAVTGVVMSGYYAGLLLGSFHVPRLVARVGHVRVFAALLSLGSTASLFHALMVEPVTWFLMRLMTGYCFAGAFIVAESWLNGAASNANRGTLLSLYMVDQFGALAAGQFLLNVADPRGFDLFALASVLISVAAVPLLLASSPAPQIRTPRAVRLRELYLLSPLGVVGVIGIGFSHSALYAMGPVFAQSSGLSLALTSTFMAVLIAGGVLLQWPVGMLSDRFDRRVVIVAVTLLAALAAMSSLPIARPPAWWLFVQFFIIGGMSLPMYALCAAHANDFLSREQMVGASSALLLSYGIGAALGPTAAAFTMQALGPAGLPLFLLVIHASIGGFALWRMTRRPVVPAEERVPHVRGAHAIVGGDDPGPVAEGGRPCRCAANRATGRARGRLIDFRSRPVAVATIVCVRLWIITARDCRRYLASLRVQHADPACQRSSA